MDNFEPDHAAVTKAFETFSAGDPKQSPLDAISLFDKGRKSCPVAHSAELGGYYIFLKDKDVRKAMSDWRTYASGPSVSRPLAENEEDQFRFPPLDYDPPENSFWRELFISVVNPKAAARVKSLLLEDIAKIFDEMAARGHGDLAVEIGDVVPARAIFYLLGIEDTSGQEEIFELNRVMLAEFNDPAKRAHNLAKIAKFGWAEAQKRREHPRDDALTAMAHAERDGRPMTEQELGDMLVSMLAGGSGTTATAIADLLYEVLSRPNLREKLLADPSLIPVAVEESLRLHTPFVGLFRRTTKEVQVSGETVPEGSSVLMCWQAANLDPDSFEDPHAFQLDREPGRHLTFGMGRHACPGSPLARMELISVLETMLTRYPNVALASLAPIEAKFIGGNAVAIPSLPVVFP